MGEIESSSNGYSKGVDQLERRLDFLEWSIRHLRDSVTDITRVGHLFMPYSEAAAGNAQGRDDTNTCIHICTTCSYKKRKNKRELGGK